MDGTLFTEFSIDGSIFPETNHNYGNGPLTDGISLSYNSKALLNRPMELDPDKFFLQIAGESYTIHSGTLTIKSVNGNSVSGDFSTDMLTSSKNNFSMRGRGHFENVPVYESPVENQ